MRTPLHKMVVLLLAVSISISAVGIYAMIKKINALSKLAPLGNRISRNTLSLLSDMKNDDVIWDHDFIGTRPVELTGATLLLLDVQEDINPFLIDTIGDKNKFVAAHVLLTFRISTAFELNGENWNGLIFQDDSSEITFEGNDLQALQKYWREKLQP